MGEGLEVELPTDHPRFFGYMDAKGQRKVFT